LSPPRHRLLERQLRRALGGAAVSPELEPLLALVDETYQASDDERARYDRMLVLVSDEHRERNEELTLLLQPGIFGIVRLNAGSGMVRCEGYPHPMCGRRGRFEDTRSQLLSVVAPEDRERVAAELAPRDASGDLTTRFRVMRPEGTRWIELRARWTQERVQWAGVAIDVTSAVESSERQLAETRRYNQTILALGRELTDRWGDLGYTAARLTEAVARAASVARTTVWLMLEDGSGLRELDGFDAERGVHTQGAVLLARDYPRYFEAVGSDRLLAVTDAWTDPATDEFRHTLLERAGIRSLLDAGVRAGGRLVGLLCCAHVGSPRAWTAEEQLFVSSAADLVSLALESAARKRAEDKLAQQGRFLRQVIDAVPNLISVKDTSLRYTLANQATADLFGTSVDALVGRRDEELHLPPEEAETIARADRSVLRTHQACVIAEQHVTDARGEGRYLQTVKIPIVSEEGVQVLDVSTDISAHKQEESERAALEAALRQTQKLDSLGLLAGGVAHDFNNLLTPILAYAEVLGQELPPEHPLHEDVQDMVTAARRARELTTQLLAFGRKQVLALRPLSLSHEVNELQRMLARVLPEYIHIEVQLDPEIGAIRADASQLHQVLVNLALNARDALGHGGRLLIKTAMVPGELDGLEAQLLVSDDGHGMDEATVARIFEPFFTTKPRGHGTGLGLAMVHGIVEQHGGRISVISRVGEGTTFDLRFPVVGGPVEQVTGARASVAAGDEGGRTVLVVEDEPAVRRLVKRLLEDQGYRVIQAGSAEDALLQAEAHVGVIDLLVTDVVLPRMNGRALFDRMASEHPGVRVVFMSGHAHDVLGAHLQDGIGLFLHKPFAPDELAATVRLALAS
jgi:two-component system cell cycle sensor histidine kinase/response regulator CckA